MSKREIWKSGELRAPPLAEIILHNQEEWRKGFKRKRFWELQKEVTPSFDNMSVRIIDCFGDFIHSSHIENPPLVGLAVGRDRSLENSGAKYFYPRYKYWGEEIEKFVEANARWLTRMIVSEEPFIANYEQVKLPHPWQVISRCVDEGKIKEVSGVVADFHFCGGTDGIDGIIREFSESGRGWCGVDNWLRKEHDPGFVQLGERGVSFVSVPGIAHVVVSLGSLGNIYDLFDKIGNDAAHELIHALSFTITRRNGVDAELELVKI